MSSGRDGKEEVMIQIFNIKSFDTIIYLKITNDQAPITK
jgi:hypothetical protein